MNPFDGADADTIVAGYADWIGSDELAHLATHPLACIQTEYPHYAHPLDGQDGHVRPSSQHPIFYGCYDWHSAVHSHWSLIRQLRLFEDHPLRPDIIDAIDPTMTVTNAEAEAAFLAEHPRFERPYGWGWLLRLVGELTLWTDELAASWRAALDPLATTVLELVEGEFLSMERPLRVGTHGNAAFGLCCLFDYAEVVGDSALRTAVADRARDWYLDDETYPLAYEPLGWDFLSPALLEAEVMARVLEPATFDDWVEGFLPTIRDGELSLEPMAVNPADGDGMAMHLVGLDLARAWSLAALSDYVDSSEMASLLNEAARHHAVAGLTGAFTEDYAGSHWLSSFALYLLTRNEGGIGP